MSRAHLQKSRAAASEPVACSESAALFSQILVLLAWLSLAQSGSHWAGTGDGGGGSGWSLWRGVEGWEKKKRMTVFPASAQGVKLFRWLVLQAWPALLSALSSPSSSRAEPPLAGRQRGSAGGEEGGWGVYGGGGLEEMSKTHKYANLLKKKITDTWHHIYKCTGNRLCWMFRLSGLFNGRVTNWSETQSFRRSDSRIGFNVHSNSSFSLSFSF